MTLRRPSGFIEPCLPSKVARPPSGPLWVHEIKHDGYTLHGTVASTDIRLRLMPSDN
jgi:ATP-dependent DNA ligase